MAREAADAVLGVDRVAVLVDAQHVLFAYDRCEAFLVAFAVGILLTFGPALLGGIFPRGAASITFA